MSQLMKCMLGVFKMIILYNNKKLIIVRTCYKNKNENTEHGGP